MGGGRVRIAAVHLAGREMGRKPGHQLGAALLDASPRVFLTDAGDCRLDARGWGRRGGESALVERIREVSRAAGFSGVRVGIADSEVAAGAAARRAVRGSLIVPAGEDRCFLAPLPLACLSIPGELRETLAALGFRRIGEVAARSRSELEARFGAEGLRLLRLARGKDDRPLLPLKLDEPPAASLGLEGGVVELEPLLFVLRRLLARVRQDLAEGGWCATRLEVVLELEDGTGRAVPVRPARPTLREDLLFILCRAVLEREVAGGRLPAPVRLLAVQVSGRAPSEVRQRDLFAREPRDPLAADAALTRLRARLGPEAVTRPSPRAGHRPEARNRWEPVTRVGEGGAASRGDAGEERGPDSGSLPPALRLLPRPRAVRVGTAEGRPVEVWEEGVRHRVVAAEGPERLSGDWWREPYRREYHRLLTEGGEILWVFREVSSKGENGWWLHGWWD